MAEEKCFICDLVSNLSYERSKLNIVYESNDVLAFHSTRPFAEVHVVIVSKRHITTIFDLSEADNELRLELLSAVKIAANEVISLRGACKVEMYLGAFQQVKHLHCHVIYDSNTD